MLAFVAQQAVETYGWVTAGDMVRGLALAETTPGPLIMVVQFVAFLGAYADPAPLSPWTAGVVASLLVTWVTFVPSFLFVFVGAPFIEQLRHNRALAGALTGVTAAVVGVIAPSPSTSPSPRCSPEPAPSTSDRWPSRCPTSRASARRRSRSRWSPPSCCSRHGGRCCGSSACAPRWASRQGSSSE